MASWDESARRLTRTGTRTHSRRHESNHRAEPGPLIRAANDARRACPLAADMNIQDLGSIGELVAAIATVATLVYLAVQIRSNTNAVRLAAAQSVHEAFATWYRLVAVDASLTKIVTTGLRDYSILSEVDRARFIATYMAFLLCSQDAFIKWREGSLAAELWVGWEFVMMNLVNAPG